MADYFLGTYGGGINKPFRYTEVQKHMFRLKDKSSTADRIVPAQPLAFYNKQGKLTRYNLRKFSELPFQLIRCYRFKVTGVQIFSHGVPSMVLHRICMTMFSSTTSGCMPRAVLFH